MFKLNKEKVLVVGNSIIIGVNITLDAKMFKEMKTIEEMESVFDEACRSYLPSLGSYRAKPSSPLLYGAEWLAYEDTTAVKIVDGLMGTIYSPIVNHPDVVTFGLLLEFDSILEDIYSTIEFELVSFNEKSFVKSVSQYNANQRIALFDCNIDGSVVTQQLLMLDDSLLLSDLEEMFKVGKLELILTVDCLVPAFYKQENGVVIAQILKSTVGYDHAYEHSLSESSLISHCSLMSIIKSMFRDFELQFGSVVALPEALSNMVFVECVKTLDKIYIFTQQNAMLTSIDVGVLSEFRRTVHAKMTIEQVQAQVRKILI
jgi:hypothetical protein